MQTFSLMLLEDSSVVGSEKKTGQINMHITRTGAISFSTAHLTFSNQSKCDDNTDFHSKANTSSQRIIILTLHYFSLFLSHFLGGYFRCSALENLFAHAKFLSFTIPEDKRNTGLTSSKCFSTVIFSSSRLVVLSSLCSLLKKTKH